MISSASRISSRVSLRVDSVFDRRRPFLPLRRATPDGVMPLCLSAMHDLRQRSISLIWRVHSGTAPRTVDTQTNRACQKLDQRGLCLSAADPACQYNPQPEPLSGRRSETGCRDMSPRVHSKADARSLIEGRPDTLRTRKAHSGFWHRPGAPRSQPKLLRWQHAGFPLR